MTDLLDDLNPAQREAVTHGGGPLLVLAGAGSGKTRVLTYRIAHLIRRGDAQPWEITAVTFTNKAAREMRERVESLVGGTLGGGFVGTFHRWALMLLRRHPEAAGLPPRFAILDSDDQRALITRVLKEMGHDGRDPSPRAVLARISATANAGRGPASLEAALSPLDRVAAEAWQRYRKAKKAAGAIDFDDMLVLAGKVLRQHETIQEQVRRQARWLLVDEFQDTNAIQLDLLALALDGERNLTAVGDEDQSIYRWRGAEMENILAFERHFAGARVVALEQNYRSTAPILSAAGALIAKNALRRGKNLFTERVGGEPVVLTITDDERGEARWVADHLEELAPEHGFEQLAVLVRTNAQTRPFEEELTRRRIPHRVVGGLRFWQRAEVKDALAYLRLVVRPEDVVAFQRVVNVPARGIGAATLDVLARHAESVASPLPVAAAELPEGLTPRARQALGAFFRLLDEARTLREALEPGDLVGWLLEGSGLLALYDGAEPDKVARRENLAQLAAAVAEAAASGQSLEELLDGVALLEEDDEHTAPEAVSLMTLHAAKGLEFDVVVLAGLEDGLLPHASARDEPDGLEEERRLTYVGMTRARRRLALTAARSRFLFGQRQPTRPSRFLLELPRDAYRDLSDLPIAISEPAAEATPRRPVGSVAPAPAPRSSRARIAATAVDENGTGWRPGDRVRHLRFGSGVVLSCQGRGPGLKLVVYFDRAGRKTLVPTVARLEKA